MSGEHPKPAGEDEGTGSKQPDQNAEGTDTGAGVPPDDGWELMDESSKDNVQDICDDTLTQLDDALQSGVSDLSTPAGVEQVSGGDATPPVNVEGPTEVAGAEVPLASEQTEQPGATGGHAREENGGGTKRPKKHMEPYMGKGVFQRAGIPLARFHEQNSRWWGRGESIALGVMGTGCISLANSLTRGILKIPGATKIMAAAMPLWYGVRFWRARRERQNIENNWNAWGKIENQAEWQTLQQAMHDAALMSNAELRRVPLTKERELLLKALVHAGPTPAETPFLGKRDTYAKRALLTLNAFSMVKDATPDDDPIPLGFSPHELEELRERVAHPGFPEEERRALENLAQLTPQARAQVCEEYARAVLSKHLEEHDRRWNYCLGVGGLGASAAAIFSELGVVTALPLLLQWPAHVVAKRICRQRHQGRYEIVPHKKGRGVDIHLRGEERAKEEEKVADEDLGAAKEAMDEAYRHYHYEREGSDKEDAKRRALDLERKYQALKKTHDKQKKEEKERSETTGAKFGGKTLEVAKAGGCIGVGGVSGFSAGAIIGKIFSLTKVPLLGKTLPYALPALGVYLGVKLGWGFYKNFVKGGGKDKS